MRPPRGVEPNQIGFRGGHQAATAFKKPSSKDRGEPRRVVAKTRSGCLGGRTSLKRVRTSPQPWRSHQVAAQVARGSRLEDGVGAGGGHPRFQVTLSTTKIVGNQSRLSNNSLSLRTSTNTSKAGFQSSRMQMVNPR